MRWCRSGESLGERGLRRAWTSCWARRSRTGSGARRAAENSLAFQAACAAGYGIELDVQLSADGEAMVFHDDKLTRMTGAEGRIRDRTAAELAELRLAGSDEKIPTLLETLAVVGHRAMVHIELKTPYGEVGPLEQRTHEVIADHNGPVCVIGFNPYSHAWFAQLSACCAAWTATPTTRPTNGGPSASFAALEHVESPGRTSGPGLTCPSEKAGIREAGMPVVAWTVRDAAQWDRIKDGCDNLIFEGFAPNSEGAA